jgi:hypothetical protein
MVAHFTMSAIDIAALPVQKSAYELFERFNVLQNNIAIRIAFSDRLSSASAAPLVTSIQRIYQPLLGLQGGLRRNRQFAQP